MAQISKPYFAPVKTRRRGAFEILPLKGGKGEYKEN